jgi:hypothetical protein
MRLFWTVWWIGFISVFGGGGWWTYNLTHPVAWPADTKSAQIHLMEMSPTETQFLQGIQAHNVSGDALKTGHAHSVEGMIFTHSDGTICILAEEAEIELEVSIQSPAAAACFAAALQDPVVQTFISHWEADGKKVSPVWADE